MELKMTDFVEIDNGKYVLRLSRDRVVALGFKLKEYDRLVTELKELNELDEYLEKYKKNKEV